MNLIYKQNSKQYIALMENAINNGYNLNNLLRVMPEFAMWPTYIDSKTLFESMLGMTEQDYLDTKQLNRGEGWHATMEATAVNKGQSTIIVTITNCHDEQRLITDCEKIVW